METIRPGVVIAGRTYYPSGHEWLLAYALAGCSWALDALNQLDQDYYDSFRFNHRD